MQPPVFEAHVSKREEFRDVVFEDVGYEQTSLLTLTGVIMTIMIAISNTY